MRVGDPWRSSPRTAITAGVMGTALVTAGAWVPAGFGSRSTFTKGPLRLIEYRPATNGGAVDAGRRAAR
ncbi:hypothetical protein AU194_12455 [Mycobacterium sp. GA-2829]|nr:hypothetical protein AU194_12455 [Mycobacterium sp. GA-2829]